MRERGEKMAEGCGAQRAEQQVQQVLVYARRYSSDLISIAQDFVHSASSSVELALAWRKCRSIHAQHSLAG